jgi:hypothetical protein
MLMIHSRGTGHAGPTGNESMNGEYDAIWGTLGAHAREHSRGTGHAGATGNGCMNGEHDANWGTVGENTHGVQADHSVVQ